MSTRPPSSPDNGPESEPEPPATLPGTGQWGDTDINLGVGPGHGPTMMFAHPTPPLANDRRPTVGHIGRYALKEQIGAGGLGTVYAAHDPLLSRLIAIKTLNLEIPAEERASFNELFLREARAAGGLSHPHIVTVFDAGIHESGHESSAYIAMELLKGRDLRQLREEGWRPTPAQAALIVRRVADALAYAHSKGIVHRDVKPANIFMVGRTQPRVLDFGIARVAHEHDGGGGDVAAGSPYYMSPEQVRQQPVDRRADVFSLGVVLYELLTGEKPFKGSRLDEITRAVLEHQPPLADQVDRKVPHALAEITARAMDKLPEQRFRSARAFSRELRHWLDEHPQEADDAVPMTPAPAAKGASLKVGVAVVAAFVALAAGWLMWSHGDDTPAPVAAAAAAPPQTVAAVPTTALAAAPAPAPAITPPIAPSPDSMPAMQPAPAAEAAPTVADMAATTLSRPTPGALPATGAGASAKVVAKETPKERRLREAREREAKAAAAPAAPLPTGTVHIAVSPWGQVEVDGKSAGTTPPLNELTLPEGRHEITLRNDDYPPYTATVTVSPGQPVSVKHRFGS